MAFVAPTAADIKARYPEFEAVSDTLIGVVLAEALYEVGDSWIENDRRPAIMAYVGHALTVQEVLTRSVPGQGQLVSKSVGDVTLKYAVQSATAGASDDFSSTVYGLKFIELRRRSFPPFLTV